MSIIHSVCRTAPLLRDTLRFALVAAVLGALFGLAPLGLRHAWGAEASHLRIGVGAYGITQDLELGLNKSLILDLPADVHEVIVSQPGVAGAIMRHKRRAIVQGVGTGETNVFFLDAAGEAIAVLDVIVRPQRSDVAVLIGRTLARVLPGSSIQVEAIEGDSATNRVVLSGFAQSGDDIAKAIAIAAQFAGTADN